MTAVRVAVQIAPARADYARIRDAAAEADALGVDAIFNWDHFFPLGSDRQGAHFECWTMLGAWAESTRRAEIGALVSCVGYGNPDLHRTAPHPVGPATHPEVADPRGRRRAERAGLA